MTAKTSDFPGLQFFLFNTPLYARSKLGDDLGEVRKLYGRHQSGGQFVKATVDGFCPFCKDNSVFSVKGISIPSGDPWNNIKKRWAYDRLDIECTRDSDHEIHYWIEIHNLEVAKIGQTPSVADIAINEARQKFRSVLKGDNWSELYKAIGLAAHGEGIGAFVYLRRVFERLIHSRFNEFKTAEEWNELDFGRLRMDEKVGFLKGHLPPYLVEIRKIYGIFSQGIHELDNEACLEFFDVGKQSITIILEDDLKHQQELLARKEMADAVRKFSGVSPSAGGSAT